MGLRVLVIDDSAFMRRVLSEMINEDKYLEVVDTARNGEEAFKKIKTCNPHVITLDLNMPLMNGLEFMKRFFSLYQIPIIVISSETQTRRSHKTIQALELGAFDFIPKPSGAISLDINRVKNELQEKIKAAGASSSRAISRQLSAVQPRVKGKGVKILPTVGAAGNKIVVIGASTGGPRAIKEVLASFEEDFPTGILVVQHMPEGFTYSFAQRLNELSAIRIREAKTGDRIQPGVALIAPGNYHLVLNKGERVDLLSSPRIHGVRPAVDITLRSVAQIYQEKTIAVILTGMGKDGAAGMKMVKQFHGRTIVQDEFTSVVFGMPKAAIDNNSADLILPLPKIASAIVESL